MLDIYDSRYDVYWEYEISLWIIFISDWDHFKLNNWIS